MDSENDFDEESNENQPANAISPSEIVGFVGRNAARHAWFGASIAVGIVAMGLLASRVVPMKYDATSRILVDDTAAKTEALSSPDRALPNWDPANGIVELLTQKSSLVAIVEETGLLARWEANRSGLFRVKDQLIAAIAGAPTPEEKKEALALMLKDHVYLSRDKNIVTIQVIWKDPESAYKVAKRAQEKLIETVRSRETGVFSSAISILEEEAKRASEAIEPALTSVIQAREQSAKNALKAVMPVSGSVVVTRSVGGGTNRASKVNSSLAKDKGPTVAERLAEIGNKIRSVEEPWHRRQVELEARMAELKTVYGQAHPLVIQQDAQIKAAASPPPDLVDLRNTQTQLLNEIQSAPNETAPKGGTRVQFERVSAGMQALAPAPRVRLGGRDDRDVPDEDPTVTAAKAELTDAISKYGKLTERLASARLQFTTAQVAFNTRYVVIGEPEMPRKPLKPLRLIVAIASVFVGILSGILAGAVREIVSGRIREPWQLKSLGIRIIGELPIPKRLEK